MVLGPGRVVAQNSTHLDVLRGLAPVSALNTTEAGRAALARKFAVTGAIQHGIDGQPTLLPFAEQQQLALRDAFITDGNAYELADGLGTSLGNAYQHLTAYTRSAEGKTDYTNVSPAVAKLIAFTSPTTKSDANSGKYFFANATVDMNTGTRRGDGDLARCGRRHRYLRQDLQPADRQRACRHLGQLSSVPDRAASAHLRR